MHGKLDLCFSVWKAEVAVWTMDSTVFFIGLAWTNSTIKDSMLNPLNRGTTSDPKTKDVTNVLQSSAKFSDITKNTKEAYFC